MEELEIFKERLKDVINDCKEKNILKEFLEQYSEEELFHMVFNDLFSDKINQLLAEELSIDEKNSD